MGLCHKCGKTIHILKYRCENCKQTFCRDCMVKVEVPSYLGPFFELIDEMPAPEYSWLKFGRVYCPDCAAIFRASKKKLLSAISCQDEVELVSINYKRYDKSSMRRIESYFNKDRSESESELKILAKYFDCDMVVNVKVIKDTRESETESGGTYIYTVWQYVGDAVKRL